MTKPPVRSFWSRAKEALEDKRLPATQAYVAKKLGLSQPAVHLWTKPNGYPTLENTISLAEHLDVNVEWLLTERGPKRPLPQDATAQRLLDAWSKLSEGDKRELIGTALGMLRRADTEATPKEYRRA